MVLVDKINRSGDLVNELCRDGNAVNKAYRSGELIYQRCINEEVVGKYLTFDMITSGTVYYIANSDSVTGKTIEYSINGGNWNRMTSSLSGVTFDVNQGDSVRFRGDNEGYGIMNSHTKLICTADFNIIGNIMSLINSTNFSELYTVGYHTFDSFFRGSENWLDIDCNVVDASELLLPATTLGDSSYSELFFGCTKLVKAPVLPATTLAKSCYWGMFWYCTSLTEIKCYATDISAVGCTSFWVKEVTPTGTFVKAASMNDWQTGASGIPEGWTVINA